MDHFEKNHYGNHIEDPYVGHFYQGFLVSRLASLVDHVEKGPCVGHNEEGFLTSGWANFGWWLGCHVEKSSHVG